MQLELNEEEVRVLAETLESYLGQLSTEIGHTDSMDYREGLKRRREMLVRIAAALKEGPG
jgi:hypothetical protein